jgi:hypothetical protein
MKNWKNWLVVILALALFGTLMWFILTTNTDKPFKQLTFTDNNYVHNRTEVKYLDTLVLAGLHELDIKDESILILPLTKRISGNIELKAHIRQVKGGYIIWIDKFSRQTNFQVLAHELIHLQQYKSNKLVMLGDTALSYEGIIYNIDALPEYTDRPWEKEAFEKQDELMVKMLSVLW